MPEAYVKMRDKFKADGLSDRAAKSKAARIYNSNPDHKSNPVTNQPDRPRRVGVMAKRGS